MWKWLIFSISICSALVVNGQSQEKVGKNGLKQLIPDFATAQFAGSIGLLSGGFGYQFAHNKLELDVLAGYLPEYVGSIAITTAAVKFNYLPFKLSLGEKLQIKPLSVGIMAAYTFGDDFWGLPPDRYPGMYYTFSTAWHGYLQFGSSVSYPVKSNRLSLYYELNASAEEIVTLIQNPNFITPNKVFNLAIGSKYYF